MDTTALFSPSKARHQESLARDWLYIDAWLSRKYRVVPTFERNEQTLQALLSLASASDSADETRVLRWEVEKTALGELRERERVAKEGGGEFYEAVEAALGTEGEEALEALAEAAVALDVKAEEGGLEMGRRVVELTNRRFELQEEVRGVEAQSRALQAEHDRVKALLAELQDEGFEVAPELPQQIAEWQRNSKHLKAKIAEYDERLGGFRSSGNDGVRFEDIENLTAEIQKQKERLDHVNKELEIFQDLPADVRGAQRKLDEARRELSELTTKRDRLFEQLSHG